MNFFDHQKVEKCLWTGKIVVNVRKMNSSIFFLAFIIMSYVFACASGWIVVKLSGCHHWMDFDCNCLTFEVKPLSRWLPQQIQLSKKKKGYPQQF